MRNKSACWWWWSANTNDLRNHESSIQLFRTWVWKTWNIKIGWAWKLINSRKCRFCLCFSCLFSTNKKSFLHSHVRDDSHSQGSSDSLWIFINLFQLSFWIFSTIFLFNFIYIFYKRKEKRNWPHTWDPGLQYLGSRIPAGADRSLLASGHGICFSCWSRSRYKQEIGGIENESRSFYRNTG